MDVHATGGAPLIRNQSADAKSENKADDEPKEREAESEGEEDSARHLPRPQTLLDHTETVLAVDEGRHRRQDSR